MPMHLIFVLILASLVLTTNYLNHASISPIYLIQIKRLMSNNSEF